jgi:putative hydrolase of the HAD superfamily
MAIRPVKAITFDFWRTLFLTGPNQKERRMARVELLCEAVDISPESAKEALKAQEKEFLRIHVYEQRTLTPNDSIPLLESHLEIEIPEELAQTLAGRFGQVILDHPPEPVEGALEAVKAAAEHVPVGVISDTGISPGKPLEELLNRYGFMDYFSSLSFSDEVGVAKPQSAMFYHAAHGLNVEANELFHLGDLEPTDIVGAINVGAQAGLFGGDNDRFLEENSAHRTYASWKEFISDVPILVGAQSK